MPGQHPWCERRKEKRRNNESRPREMLVTPPSAAGDRPRKATEYFRPTGRPADPRYSQPSAPKTCQDLIRGVDPTRTSGAVLEAVVVPCKAPLVAVCSHNDLGLLAPGFIFLRISFNLLQIKCEIGYTT